MGSGACVSYTDGRRDDEEGIQITTGLKQDVGMP